MHISMAVLLSITIVGCGQVESLTGKKEAKASGPAAVATPVPISNSHSMLIADASALPECNAAGEGWLVYLKAEKKFQACQSAAWADVDIATNKAASGFICVSNLSGSGMAIRYFSTTMSSGDIFVSGSVIALGMEYSSSAYLSSKQKASEDSNIVVIYDATASTSSNGSVSMSLDKSKSVLTVVYSDTDLAGGSKSWTIDKDHCVSNAY